MAEPAPAAGPGPKPTPLLVLPGPARATDNLLLLFSGDQRLQTSAELLAMLSPEVLHDAVELAKEARASKGDAGAEAAGRLLLELAMREDSADDWLLALRLVHPAVLVKDRPHLSWVDAERILGLADKYHMPALQSLCEATLAGFLRSGSAGAPTDAPGLLRVFASAQRLGLPDLTAACSSVICGSLKKVQAGPPGERRQGSAFLSSVTAWQRESCKNDDFAHLAGHLLERLAPLYQSAADSEVILTLRLAGARAEAADLEQSVAKARKEAAVLREELATARRGASQG